MVPNRQVYTVRRYNNRQGAFINFIYRLRFVLIAAGAAVIVLVILFNMGILHFGKATPAPTHTPKPTVSATVKPTPTPSPSPSVEPTATPTATPAAVKFDRVLKYTKPNMQGDDVWALQEKLGLKADGYFGQSTADALKEWQEKHNLPADGIAGPDTLAKLGLK